LRILFLVYSPQDSLVLENYDGITKCPWIDSLLEELKNYQNISIAVALPVNSDYLLQDQKNNIKLYGLPNPKERNIFRKTYNKLVYATESIKINSHIKAVVDDFKPDIIQTFGTENPFGLIIPELSKPVILHIQGFLTVWKAKYFSGIPRCEQLIYTSLKDLIFRGGSYNGFFPFLKRAKVEEKVISNCNYFMGRTDFDKRVISLLSPSSAYFHCEEFIRKEFFLKQWNLPLGNDVTCISILNGTTYKGIDLLIESSLILQRYTTITFRFKICGVSLNDEFVRILKKKFKKKTSFDYIEFLGKLNATEIVTQLSNANIYVHPSYMENSPNSICEAMVLGMPIVATNVGGLDSLITDKIEGLLVQEGDPFSFAAAIVELANNYNYAELLGKNAREKAIIRHNPEEIGMRLLDIYNKVLS
jgi:glycosyltransferase involved in cell wall biosynthesis